MTPDDRRHLDLIARAAPEGLPLSAALREAIAASYATPIRHYHTLAHVAEVAGHYAAVAAGPGWRDPASVFAAVLSHDAVYDVSRSDNEALSAELGRRWCAEHLGIDGDRCADLVNATASHGAASASVDTDPDLALFLDCDLAILGAPPDRYDAYEEAIAREYGALYPPEAYRKGRAAFLASMSARDTPFHTAWFTDRFAAAARRNLARAATALAS